MTNTHTGFISRIRLRDDVTIADLRRQRILQASDYQLHKLVWNIMSYAPEQPRDFIFRCDTNNDGMPEFMVVSKTEPQKSFGIWDISTKPYAPKLNEGDVLHFSLRCNPVKTPFERNRQEKGIKQKRVDVIAVAKKEAKKEAIEKGEEYVLGDILQNESCAWLKARSEKNGFILSESSLLIGKYDVRDHPKEHNKKLSVLDLSGILKVSDREKFTSLLFNGLGHAKAWGCGLMLVKRG